MSFPLGINAGFAAALGALGKRLDPYLGFNFLVELESLLVGGFSKVEGLESTIETQDYVEGGENRFVHKRLKGVTYPSLALTHGLTDLDTLWKWYDDTRRGIIQRRNGTILLLDSQRLPARWWNFKEALPVKWSGPTLDASQDGQVATERIELIHRGLTEPPESQVAAVARGVVGMAR